MAKYSGNRDSDIDVPDDISLMFKMVDFSTKNVVIGKDSCLITNDEINSLFDS